MRVLVTGSTGFVGKFLVAHLLECGDTVIAAGNTRTSTELHCVKINLEVGDPNACCKVLEEVRPDALYNLAGVAFVPDAERDFARTVATNVLGPYNLLKAISEVSPSCKFLAVSSSEIFGKVAQSAIPISEDTPARPHHNYGVSKLMAELVVQRFAQEGKVNTVVARAFNHIGPGQRSDFVVSSFAFQLAQIARGKAPPLLKVGNLEALRDFTDVRDIVRGYRSAIQKGSGTYNFCSGRAVAVRSILDMLIGISGLDVKVEVDPQRVRPIDVPEIRGSALRAQKELGWQPNIQLMDSLRAIYEHWLQEA